MWGIKGEGQVQTVVKELIKLLTFVTTNIFHYIYIKKKNPPVQRTGHKKRINKKKNSNSKPKKHSIKKNIFVPYI